MFLTQMVINDILNNNIGYFSKSINLKCCFLQDASCQFKKSNKTRNYNTKKKYFTKQKALL